MFDSYQSSIDLRDMWEQASILLPMKKTLCEWPPRYLSYFIFPDL